MTRVVADISISLDGFVTGPDPDLRHGLGHGGEPLHTWAIDSDDPVDRQVLAEAAGRSGAVVMGRRLFDIVDGPGGWNDDMGYGADLAVRPPFFVVTHRAPAPGETRLPATMDFAFVTTGLADAIAAARGRVGSEADVVVMGGGSMIAQCLDAGLLDQLSLHISPVILGTGTPLFAGVSRRLLTQREVRVSTTATHVVYDVGP